MGAYVVLKTTAILFTMAHAAYRHGLTISGLYLFLLMGQLFIVKITFDLMYIYIKFLLVYKWKIKINNFTDK